MEENGEERQQHVFFKKKKAWKLNWKAPKNAKRRKPARKEEEKKDDHDRKDEGRVGRRGRDPRHFSFLLEKKHLEKISWKTLTRAHASPLYWTNGWTNFENFFTILCSHTILIGYEYSGMSLCAQFLVFLVYRSTDGRTDRQLIAAGLPNLQLVEDNDLLLADC